MKIRVFSKVNHNGKDYDAGDEINKIKNEEASRLIDLGVAEELLDSSSDVSSEEEEEVSEDEAKKNE